MIDYFKMAMTQKYADFNGRSTRSEYWYFALAVMLIFLLLAAVIGGLAYGSGMATDGGMGVGFMILLGLLGIFYLAIIIPSISVSVRRLHDTGKSGWWYLINFVPYIGALVFIVFMCMDSQPGTNQYGPNPFELDSGDDISGHLLKDDLV